MKRISIPKGDLLFTMLLTLAAVIIPLLCGGIVFSLINNSYGAFSEYGFLRFFVSSDWIQSSGNESYGALPFVIGTLLTTLLALCLCIPFALCIALFMGEYYKGKIVSNALGTMVDLLAGIPSIIYGLWGFYLLRPIIMQLNLSPQGSGVLLASVVLSIMIIPYAASLSAEFVKMASPELKEAAYSLGATRTEVLRNVVFPVAGSGIFSSFILATGRALGETMTVTMLIGNTNHIPTSLVDTGNSMASIICNQFGEASGLKYSSLFAIALLLFSITAVVNLIGKILIHRNQIK